LAATKTLYNNAPTMTLHVHTLARAAFVYYLQAIKKRQKPLNMVVKHIVIIVKTAKTLLTVDIK
jgi:hypothetical protein